MGIYLQTFPLEEYRQLEPQRLDRVEQDTFLSLCISAKDLGNIACRMTVTAQNVTIGENGQLRFGLRYTDQDLRIVTKKPHPATLVDRYWRPEQGLILQGRHINSTVKNGYFLPYESELDDEWILDSAMKEFEQTHELVRVR